MNDRQYDHEVRLVITDQKVLLDTIEGQSRCEIWLQAQDLWMLLQTVEGRCDVLKRLVSRLAASLLDGELFDRVEVIIRPAASVRHAICSGIGSLSGLHQQLQEIATIRHRSLLKDILIAIKDGIKNFRGF